MRQVKSSDIKIGQWGRPCLVWYVSCKRRFVPRFTLKLKHRHRHRNDRRWRCETHSVGTRWQSVGEPPDAIFTVSDELSLESPIKSLLNVLLQSLESIPQIYQSIFQTNRPEIASHLVKPPPKRRTVYSEPCHVLRGEKCPDASRMFALKYRVRRDLNTDVSVFDWHARLRLAPRWRLAVAKGLHENCWDVGRAPARKICDLSSSGPALFEIWWPDIYLGGPYGPVKDKMHWPGGLKSAPGQCLCRGLHLRKIGHANSIPKLELARKSNSGAGLTSALATVAQPKVQP